MSLPVAIMTPPAIRTPGCEHEPNIYSGSNINDPPFNIDYDQLCNDD